MQAHSGDKHYIVPDDGKGTLTAGGKPVVCDGRVGRYYRTGWMIPGGIPVRTLIAGLVFAFNKEITTHQAVEFTDELIAELMKGEDT
jgi:hypothetical protein